MCQKTASLEPSDPNRPHRWTFSVRHRLCMISSVSKEGLERGSTLCDSTVIKSCNVLEDLNNIICSHVQKSNMALLAWLYSIE